MNEETEITCEMCAEGLGHCGWAPGCNIVLGED